MTIERVNAHTKTVAKAGSDVNDMRPGEMWWGNNYTNSPGTGYYMVVQFGLEHQLAWGFTGNSSAPRIFVRSRVNAVWQPWAELMRTNGHKRLWSGAYLMNASQTATLSEKVSAQDSGIVLTFSAYGSGAAQNYGWHHSFVPKGFVAAHPGVGHNFEMTNSKYTIPGGKYLYIHDDRIVGYAQNTDSGSANGITFNNSNWVLREVWGV